jgi:hypothetical protein
MGLKRPLWSDLCRDLTAGAKGIDLCHEGSEFGGIAAPHLLQIEKPLLVLGDQR